MRYALLRPLAFGDVLMRRNPSAALERLVHDPDGPPIGGFNDDLGCFALREILQQRLAIAIDVAGEAARLLAMDDQFAQRASRLHYLFAQAVHVDVAPVA